MFYIRLRDPDVSCEKDWQKRITHSQAERCPGQREITHFNWGLVKVIKMYLMTKYFNGKNVNDFKLPKVCKTRLKMLRNSSLPSLANKESLKSSRTNSIQ